MTIKHETEKKTETIHGPKSSDKIRILVIAGPTAAGKTAFAIEAARKFNGEIVSCDSMQLYRGMDIGSAKPTPEERAQVPHHLIDCIDPAASDGEFSVARYAEMAKDIIADIAARGKLPVIAGGTGLYLNALLYEMDFADAPKDQTLRSRLEEIAGREGSAALHQMLMDQDPAAAERIHPNNTKKLIRALERLAQGEKDVQPFDACRRENPIYDPLLVCLTRDRQELYDRINARVLQMMDAGLVEEVRGLAQQGLSEEYISMLGIGYKEIFRYLRGEDDLETTIDTIQKNTRHLAKRQLTWFRRYDKMFWFNISDYADDREAVKEFLAWLDQNL